MNRIAIAAISPILVLFSSCTHKTDLSLASQTLSAPTPSEYHRIGRPGVFYLLEYVSLKTNNGVVAFLPGRPLHLVEDVGLERWRDVCQQDEVGLAIRLRQLGTKVFENVERHGTRLARVHVPRVFS